MYRVATAIAGIALSSSFAQAQDVNITPDDYNFTVSINDQDIVYERNQDQSAVIQEGFAKTSRKCPPFCVHGMSAGEGVETVGELELIKFMETHVSEGKGLLIDSRIPEWFQKGTIPGAINVPFSVMSPDNQYRDKILQALGAKSENGTWDFSDATDLLLFCNGPWCDQSPRAIADLLKAGYPAEKIRYYRGGMQLWLMLGFNTVADTANKS